MVVDTRRDKVCEETFRGLACWGLLSKPNWNDSGFTISPLVLFARKWYPAACAHLLWTDLERQSALLEIGGREAEGGSG